MLMWKILLYVAIFYVFISVLDKIVRKVKAKKYGRDTTTDGTNGNNDRNDSTDNVGNRSTKSDKQ